MDWSKFYFSIFYIYVGTQVMHRCVTWSIKLWQLHVWVYIDGLVQDCSNSIADALELLQSCTKPSIWYIEHDSIKPTNPMITVSFHHNIHSKLYITTTKGSYEGLLWILRSDLCSEVTLQEHCLMQHVDGFAQDCNISIANALEILQSCTKPSIS